jgi:hypothetical protein
MTYALKATPLHLSKDLSFTDFSSCDLRGQDFSDADLRGCNLDCSHLEGAIFRGAQLRGASFYGAELTGARFSGAIIERKIPYISGLHSRVWVACSRPGALNVDSWHTSAEEHDRAGWVVAIAGRDGSRLEARYGTAMAAALIYAVYDPELPCPDFNASLADTLEDIQRCAAKEANRKL